MTVIVVRDGVMVCDQGVFSNSVMCGCAQKWCRVPEIKGGGFFAAAGDLGDAQGALRHMSDATCSTVEPKAQDMIWLRGDGAVWEKYGESEWLEYSAPFYAIGSGADVALGALAAGVDAKRAVEIAIEICTRCAGEPDIAK